MKPVRLLLLLISILSLFACRKNNTETGVMEIPVKSVAFAVKDINLSERSDWLLWGGNQPYSFNIENDTLHAVPIDEPYLLRYQPQSYPFNYIGFQLVSPAYYGNKNTIAKRSLYATSPVEVFPDIADQSNEDKFRNADALIAINYETPSGNIKDARFIHRNTLIDFKTVNLPEDAVVTVLQSEETKPFNYKPGFYKAIVVAGLVISVKTGNETYKVPLVHPQGLSGNARYTFKVVFDTDDKTLSITDLESAKWSETN